MWRQAVTAHRSKKRRSTSDGVDYDTGQLAIASEDLLYEVIYPAVTVGSQSVTPTETYTYNEAGEATTYTDRNGTVHTYGYNALGQQTDDVITTLGSGVDGSVKAIHTDYNTEGQPYLYTSYSNITETNVVNQVEDQYDAFGMLVAEYQSHSGAVTISTPGVLYTYSDPSSTGGKSRLTSITYPDDYVVNYNYSTSGVG